MNLWDDIVRPVLDALNRPETAGVGGALVSLQWAPGSTWIARLAFVGSGAALTIWLLPALIEFYGVQSLRYSVALGFFCGAGGPFVLAAFVEWVRRKPMEALRLLFGVKK